MSTGRTITLDRTVTIDQSIPRTTNGMWITGSDVGLGGGGPLAAGTDRSGSIVTGGVANITPLAPANAARTSLKGQNISTDDLWLTENGTTAVIGGVGSYQIKSLATFSIDTNQAISVIGPTTGQKWTATEK